MRRRKKEVKVNPVTKVLAIIGVITICVISLPFIAASIETHVPMSFGIYDKMEAPAKFDSKIIRGTYDYFYDWEKQYPAIARDIYDELGIQVYLVAVQYEEPLFTREEGMEFVKNYIEESGFWNDGAIYMVSVQNSEKLGYDEYSYEANIHNELIYGEDVTEYMDGNMLKIYGAAYNKHYKSMFTYYSADECFLRGMDTMADRVMHPFKTLVVETFKLMGFVTLIGTIVYFIKKHLEKKKNIEILETPIKDLHDEAVDEILDRYDSM